MITGVASNPQITTLSGKGGNEWAFGRSIPSDTDMMNALGAYLGDKKLFKTVAIVARTLTSDAAARMPSRRWR